MYFVLLFTLIWNNVNQPFQSQYILYLLKILISCYVYFNNGHIANPWFCSREAINKTLKIIWMSGDMVQ